MNPFAAAIAAAVEQSPMSNGEVSTKEGRLLLADGDGLAYYCAGNDDVSAGEARANLIGKLRSAQRACGAESIKIVTTSSASNKGFRYAVARVKPYQGQRSDGRRPKNYPALREFLNEGAPATDFDVEFTAVAEADDLFSRYALHHPDCVIYTQDKDMRMVPGWHLDWLTHVLFNLKAGTWEAWHNDKRWGRSWFWSQMLHGDAADNIPGLPFYKDGTITKSGPNKGQVTEIRCGDKSKAVLEILPKLNSDMGAITVLGPLYATCYGDRWLVEMLEQGILLWMRNDTQSSPLNVVAVGNPLHALTTHELWPAARAEIMARIAEGIIHAEAETVGDSADAGVHAGTTDGQLPSLQAATTCVEGGTGSRPLDGSGEGHDTCRLQQPARQGGEQPQEIRSTELSGLLSWSRKLFATA